MGEVDWLHLYMEAKDSAPKTVDQLKAFVSNHGGKLTYVQAKELLARAAAPLPEETCVQTCVKQTQDRERSLERSQAITDVAAVGGQSVDEEKRDDAPRERQKQNQCAAAAVGGQSVDEEKMDDAHRETQTQNQCAADALGGQSVDGEKH
eukprot:TRINITY_DN5706_c0_g1_i3.p1 TRINITY_DN5706_c0_g1~~TRINITY_DN5706_c0_g1_i3.p1  ORF type:complete len:167 (+),score=39.02 TRINITY_DN5706_c0_g1_i3:54-503(+)